MNEDPPRWPTPSCNPGQLPTTLNRSS
jgi:hypothetical protein